MLGKPSWMVKWVFVFAVIDSGVRSNRFRSIHKDAFLKSKSSENYSWNIFLGSTIRIYYGSHNFSHFSIKTSLKFHLFIWYGSTKNVPLNHFVSRSTRKTLHISNENGRLFGRSSQNSQKSLGNLEQSPYLATPTPALTSLPSLTTALSLLPAAPPPTLIPTSQASFTTLTPLPPAKTVL